MAAGCLLEPAVPADHHPVRGANKTATEVADVAVEMDCQAHHDKDRRSPTRYLASMQSKMRGGGSLYPLCPSPGDRGQGRPRVLLSREAVFKCLSKNFLFCFII